MRSLSASAFGLVSMLGLANCIPPQEGPIGPSPPIDQEYLDGQNGASCSTPIVGVLVDGVRPVDSSPFPKITSGHAFRGRVSFQGQLTDIPVQKGYNNPTVTLHRLYCLGKFTFSDLVDTTTIPFLNTTASALEAPPTGELLSSENGIVHAIGGGQNPWTLQLYVGQ